jgi:predicted DNA-binding transcriptional regulator AlpA
MKTKTPPEKVLLKAVDDLLSELGKGKIQRAPSPAPRIKKMPAFKSLPAINSQNTRDKIFLKADEIAVRYQVKAATILQWQREGRIPAAVALGKVLRFDPEEVDAALREASEVGSKAGKVLVRVI